MFRFRKNERRGARGLSLAALASLAAPWLLNHCAGESSPYDELSWACEERGSSCACRGTPEPARAGASTACPRELDCCFVQAGPDGATDCSCVAVEASSAGGEGGAGGAAENGGAASQDIACHQAALDHGSTEVVDRCPPITLDGAGVCALVYEACDPAYLESLGLVDCCEGTRCVEDASGVLVCQPD
ncbi:MAG TPA: hypothetical protein VGK73_40395 [Polyangiaceae bacterium]